MADKPKTLFVRAVEGLSTTGVDHRVILFERDDTHPTGEAFIAGPDPVEVGDSAAVARLLREGRIEEVSEGDYRKVQDERRENARRALAVNQEQANQLAKDVATLQSQVAAREQAAQAKEAELARREEELRLREEQVKALQEQADAHNKLGPNRSR